MEHSASVNPQPNIQSNFYFFYFFLIWTIQQSNIIHNNLNNQQCQWLYWLRGRKQRPWPMGDGGLIICKVLVKYNILLQGNQRDLIFKVSIMCPRQLRLRWVWTLCTGQCTDVQCVQSAVASHWWQWLGHWTAPQVHQVPGPCSHCVELPCAPAPLSRARDKWHSPPGPDNCDSDLCKCSLTRLLSRGLLYILFFECEGV